MHMFWRAAVGVALMTVPLVACSGDAPDAAPSITPTASQGIETDVIEGSQPGMACPPIDPAELTGTIAYSTVVETAADDDVFVLDVGVGEPVRLTEGGEKEFDPALSPDGTLIAYRRNPRADSDEADIWVMAVDGSGKRNLTQSAQDSNWAPAWTSDGRIVYSSMRGSGQPQLWSMQADGSGQRRIAEGWCEYVSPSPDGTEYACSASVGGRYDIVVVDESGARVDVTSTPETEFGAAWSPDGQWIVFSRDLGDRWELRRIRPDGTDEQVLAPEGVFAAWSPDGHLAWSGPGGINVANPDGSGGATLDHAADFLSWAS